MSDTPVSLLKEATDRLEEANDQLESAGDGTVYEGEEHMTECLLALKNLVEAREDTK